MDFLSKKRHYVFLNNRDKMVHIHVSQVASSPCNLWTEGKSKKYRDCIHMLEATLDHFNYEELPPIVIVANEKIGTGGISSYNHIDDVIYYNSFYHTQEAIGTITQNHAFASQNLYDIIQHELGHKKHWDAAKRFYFAHKSKYNNIDEAKKELDSKLEKYIAERGKIYLASVVSAYAAMSYDYAKQYSNNNLVNEIIAEYNVLEKTTNPYLNQLIESVINYGRTCTDGHSKSTIQKR